MRDLPADRLLQGSRRPQRRPAAHAGATGPWSRHPLRRQPRPRSRLRRFDGRRPRRRLHARNRHPRQGRRDPWLWRGGTLRPDDGDGLRGDGGAPGAARADLRAAVFRPGDHRWAGGGRARDFGGRA